ncbi:transcription initiation factor TFIID subunit 4B [Spea bombifrons]|uniref:transcription initiation factor TFIID subunit 4B n=1 Tax=Spea bombifrons TaxID=233779 RepID=UPI00234A6151|nr:transcription initiation factor TFIID subunit 4B [Spea bombifrons]
MQANQATSTAPSVLSQTLPANHGGPGGSAVLPKGCPAAASSDPTAAAAKAPVTVSLVPASQPVVPSAPVGTKLTPVTSHASIVTSGPRVTAPQQVPPPKASQTATIQLPANFQIPPGTVLIRSGNGQLMLVSQQALARAQAQVQNSNAKNAIPANTPTVQIRAVQNSKPQLLSNTTVKSIPTPVPTASLTLTTVQRSSASQSLASTSGAVKVSSSLGCRANTTVSTPTIVKICTPPTPQTTAISHGNSAVIIRAPAPEVKSVSTGSFVATPATTSTTMVIPATSVMVPGSSPITVLPIRTPTPLAASATVNACTSIMSASTVTISPTSVTSMLPPDKTFTSSSTAAVKSLGPSLVQTAVTSSSAVKLTPVTPAATQQGKSNPLILSAPVKAPLIVTSSVCSNKVVAPVTVQMSTTASSGTPNVMVCKAEPPKVTANVQPSNATDVLDNVKKCKNFLATLIKLASSGPQSPTMGQNVKNLVKNLLDSKMETEEFTTKLYKELKSSPQPYLVPFLKKSLPALRRLMPNSQEFILECGQQTPPSSVTGSNPPSFVKITATPPVHTIKQVGTTTLRVQQTTSMPTQPVNTLKTVNIKQLVVQQPNRGVVQHVAALPQSSILTGQKPGERKITVSSLLQAGRLPPGSVVKQITLPGNKVISLQASPLPIKENGTTCFREEDDINDVTSMAGVNINEENACILATNSQFVGAVIRSCHDEPFLFISALQNRILDIGKRHDIKELSSDVMNLVSHATQERLRGLIEKLTVAAQHRSMNYKQSDRYLQSSDVRAQLKFLEQLEQLEKQRKNEEEREMLLRAAKSRSNKEDPEQLRLKQKAKEMQQLELEQMQYREANLTALAAIGPRRKRPLDSSIINGLEDLHTSGSSVFGLSKPLLVQRITRVSLRDLVFCMEQEKETRYSLSLYRALLK